MKRRNATLGTDHRNPHGGDVFLGAGERSAQPPLTSSVCAFFAENRDRFGAAPICRVLTERGIQIAPRTFEAWAARAPLEAVLWDAAITAVLAGFTEPDEDGRVIVWIGEEVGSPAAGGHRGGQVHHGASHAPPGRTPVADLVRLLTSACNS